MVLALVHGQTFDNSIDIHWCGTNKHERAIVVNRHQLRNEKPKYRIPNALVWEYPVLRHKHVSRRLKLSEILPHPIVWDLLTLHELLVSSVSFVSFFLCASWLQFLVRLILSLQLEEHATISALRARSHTTFQKQNTLISQWLPPSVAPNWLLRIMQNKAPNI